MTTGAEGKRSTVKTALPAVGLLLVLGLLLVAAAASHATGAAARQKNTRAAARQSAAVCPGAPAAAQDTGRITEQVKALLAGGPGAGTPADLSQPAEQIPHATTIVATGIRMSVPARGQVIALATALQESGLRNLPGGDRDSAGLFQQRPSQGWGSREQILDPAYASTKFYTALQQVDGWQQLPLTAAAQRVQQSAYPDAYARHETLATALQQAIAPTLGAAPATVPAPAPADYGPCPGAVPATDSTPPGELPAGYQIPADTPATVRTAIRWALEQLGTPYQWGGSCTNAHGPDPAGRCDCSSLVQRAYGVAGIQLTRTTYTQVGEGTAVSTEAASLRAGDLVFTRGTAETPEHVAMVIGPGLIVQAPRTGDVVKVSQLAGPVLAARRVVAG
ncbi:cell wall-associated NlpC family hydrolase [Kitasatospora sp. MAA19]|uniref:C40 family peptidase n=1 Tax=unclassified Kitasatospora TaxID=2633591 RepID=UPI002473DE58|nr:C40 family peptidase [Kitasatospora sp. MAA19]MDH6710922.1 cell wall-associated NlpC family hydrolase [Kitasatospora sp. MAA19]